MLNYIIELSFCWLIFYLAYFFLLRQATYFTLNRSYLLLSLLGSLFIPLIEINTLSVQYLPVVLQEIAINELTAPLQTAATSEFGWEYGQLFLLIYGIGFAVAFVRLGRELFYIQSLIKQAEHQSIDNLSIANHEAIASPFSFGKYIFINNTINYPKEEYNYIIKHEAAHIHQGHGFDLLVLELLSIVFWFHPLLWLYKNALRDQHEYLADQAVLQHAPLKAYGQLLINQSICSAKIRLANHLIYSQLKKRINMMTKNRPLRFSALRYLSCGLSFLMVFGLIACQKAAEETSEEVQAMVEQMPYFKSEKCANLATEEKQKCTQNALANYINANIQYPKEAYDNNAQGMLAISFTITENGTIANPKVRSRVGYGCAEEALRVINSMQGKNLWIPGQKNGKKAAMKVVLPLNFKLSSK